MDRLQGMRVFVRVAELGSFTRAAAALELSVARTSEAVSELERALGARLLHRTTRRVSLSDEGRAYYESSRQILADVDEAEALFSHAPGHASGRLRVLMPMALARSYVVPALPKLLAKHPHLALEVRLENRSVDLFAEGVDCALSYGKPHDQDLVAQQVMATRLLTCAAPAYLRRRGVPLTPADLDQHNCVTFLALASARPAEWVFVKDGVNISRRPSGNIGFNSMEACVEAAVAGLGLTQVISSLAQRAIAQKSLRSVLAGYTAEGPGIYVVYPPQRRLSPRLGALLTFLRELFAGQGG